VKALTSLGYSGGENVAILSKPPSAESFFIFHAISPGNTLSLSASVYLHVKSNEFPTVAFRDASVETVPALPPVKLQR
jgi:hypothetical protein